MKTTISLMLMLTLSWSGFQDTDSSSAVNAQDKASQDIVQTGEEPRAGRGHGPGFGRGHGRMAGMQGDMTTLHAMFANRAKIQRSVKILSNGAEAVTESDDKKITALIQEHVPAMENRVIENEPLPPMTFHPIFVNLIKHSDEYTLTYDETKKGIKVTYKADDPFIIMLVQEHAKLVSRFIKNGMAEIHKPYSFPKGAPTAIAVADAKSADLTYTYPAIEGMGKVVQLPSATQQPREGSKIVVDLIKGGEPAMLNPGIEKVARFVNIYAGAGQAPANVEIAVVLHGDATLIGLKPDVYAERFQCEGNPHLECIQKLKNSGVKIFVCGQSLVGKGHQPDDVHPHVDVAVSALSALVNLQADGHSYVLLGK